MIRWVRVACVVLSVGATAPAWGDVPPPLPEAITLDEALRLLWEHSPHAREGRARVGVAAAEIIASGVHPNPTLSYGGLALAHGANTGSVWQHQIVLEQPLLVFGQLGVRQRHAELRLRAEREAVSAELAERSLRVRWAFAALLAAQERVEVLGESLADLERIEHIVRGRRAAGDWSTYDAARLELETTTVRISLQEARAEVEEAAGSLAAELGAPGWRPRAVGTLGAADGGIELPEGDLWAVASERRPVVRAARAAADAARGGLTLARRERLPVPALAAGTMLTQEEDSASVFFGVSIPLPIFDRGQGEVARASAELEARARLLDARLLEERARLERAQAVLARRRGLLEALEGQLAARIPALRTMAEESYRGGASGILELLDTLRSVRDIRLLHLEHREAVEVAWAELVELAALDPMAATRRPRGAGEGD